MGGGHKYVCCQSKQNKRLYDIKQVFQFKYVQWDLMKKTLFHDVVSQPSICCPLVFIVLTYRIPPQTSHATYAINSITQQ